MDYSLHDRLDDLPSFDELPLLEGLPKGTTWGLWDKLGAKDELGTLNLLTPSVVKNAYKELSEGISVSLNWSLAKPNAPNFGRKGLDHKILDHADFSAYSGFDDEIAFNTQCGSQWDGLRHHGHLASGLFYNYVKKQEIKDSKTILGHDKWNERGGIVGRGVLIDYVSYAQHHNIQYSAVESHKITHESLEQAAKEQKLELKPGDILLVRSGFTKWYNECPDAAQRDKITSTGHTFVGVPATQESIEWMWNRHFAAVAGDAPAWETLPPDESGLLFHDYFLSLWGMPIGEFWDLEKLAETCKRLGRYSFLVTSVPLNIPGGVGSPPNALAIF